VNREHANPHFLPGVALAEGIRAVGELGEAVRNVDAVLMAVPSQHMRAIAGALRPSLRRRMAVVSCSKGVEGKSGLLMPEVLADMLPESVIAVMSGPSFAAEIARDLPCGVVLACREWDVGETVARRIASPTFCVHLADDVVGAALGGAMKNVISIASGIVHGRNLGENARATVVTLGLVETERLGLVKGARAETFLGLAGAGDFMLTANSLQSRNTSLGVSLAQGRSLAQILGERKQVTEGAATAGAVALLAARLHVQMPVTEALDGVLNRGVSLDEAIAKFVPDFPLLRTGPGR
jgi:glycerol-3-phosphate dehydrogenase (NAD(P)+)